MNSMTILGKAIDVTSPPLSWQVCEHDAVASPVWADAILALSTKHGLICRFAAEVKSVVRTETLRKQGSRRSESSDGTSRLLVVPYMSKKNAALFQEAGLNFIDTAGNAFIDVPGSYVSISGNPRTEPELVGSGHEVMGSASALRVVFTLNRPGFSRHL